MINKFAGSREKVTPFSTESFIRKVDFDLLKDIFFKKMKGTELQGRENILLGKDSIVFSCNRKDPLGSLDLENNIIQISPEKNIKSAKKFNVKPELEILHTLIHEETHALAKSRYKHNEDQESGYMRVNPEPHFIHQRIWYMNFTIGPVHYVFKLFNESVTEKIAREVFHEYCSRNHDLGTPDEVDQYWNALKKAMNIEHYNFYGPDVSLLEKIIAKIAQATQMSEDAVWDSIKSGYFIEGIDILDNPIVKIHLAEIFSPDFLTNLSKYHYYAFLRKMHYDEVAVKVYKDVTGNNPNIAIQNYIKAYMKKVQKRFNNVYKTLKKEYEEFIDMNLTDIEQ